MNSKTEKKYIAAVDGGGTKTRLIIGDNQGGLYADVAGPGSNHQICGRNGTYEVISSLFQRALDLANLEQSEISCVVLGLAGADMREDFPMLRKLLQPAFADVDLDIVNDAWIIMRSTINTETGAVCICGTGANAAAVNAQGDKVILRSLDYMIGSFGGGGDIAVQALHYAFRAEEKTGEATALCTELPRLFAVNTLEEMIPEIYPHLQEAALVKMRGIAEIVFRLANQGDVVCQNILIEMGRVLGQMTAGVIARTGQSETAIPVVLGGRVMAGDSPLLIDALTLELHRKVPGAELIRAWLPPVAGAWLLALDKIAGRTDEKAERKIGKVLSAD